MSSILPSGYDPQASLDAALFSSTGSTPSSSSDPAVDALETIGGSYGDEIATLQQELQPSTGAYDASGTVDGGSSSSDDPTTQLESTLSSLLGGDTSSSTLDALMTETAGAGTSGDEQLLNDALPALVYDQSGSLLDGGASSLVDLLG